MLERGLRKVERHRIPSLMEELAQFRKETSAHFNQKNKMQMTVNFQFAGGKLRVFLSGGF